MDDIQRVDELIAVGRTVLASNNAGDSSGMMANNGLFAGWRSRSLAFLDDRLGTEHEYAKRFRDDVKHLWKSSVETGIGILEAVHTDIGAGLLPNKDLVPVLDTLNIVEQIASRFHAVVRQLRQRHANSPTLDVKYEYDVQDLLHALLCLWFEDIRAEEATPSYAGQSTRIDFLLKAECVGLECKMARAGLDAKTLGSELIEDIARYQTHPDCGTLVCLVYDPDGRIRNPRGVERDLEKLGGRPVVRVHIVPRA